MSKKRKWRRFYFLVCCIAMLAIFLPNYTAQATEENKPKQTSNLFVEAEVGYNGMYVNGVSTPVKLELTNNFSRDLKGDLVLNIMNSEGNSVAHIMPLEITSGSTIEARLTVDGTFSKQGTLIQFYEGGVSKGDTVAINGTRYVEGRMISSNQVIGIAASDPDTLNFVAFFNNNGIDVTPIVLGEDFYASTHHDLSMFSIIALNDVATSEWSAEKVKALKDWVANGGTLLVGGGAGYSQTAAKLAEIMPVEGSSTMSWGETNSLSNYAESQEQIEPLTIVNGKLIKGESLLEYNGIPIIAHSSYGGGKVYYIAFDLGLKPFANWDGRTSFIQRILNAELLTRTFYPPDFWWGLDNSTSNFPRLQSPNVGWLLLIFAIYTLIVAPILYLVLRRMDRREWSWWLIPVLAVCSTIIILFIGTRDKSEQYVHTVKIAQIEGEAVREIAASKVFVPNSKDITLTLPDNSYARINYANRNYVSNSEVDTKKHQRINIDGNQRTVTFTNNKYWTMKSVLTGEQIFPTDQYGTLKASYLQDNNDEAIQITNETNQAINHLSLIYNGQLYYIGSLEAGKDMTYRLPFSASASGQHYVIPTYSTRYYGNNYGGNLVSGARLSWDKLNRETALLDYPYETVPYRAALVGFSYDDTEKYLINNKPVKSDELTMWVVNLSDLFTQFGLQKTLFPVSIDLVGDGSYAIDDQEYFTLYEGELLFKYFVPVNDVREDAPLLGQFVLNYISNQVGISYSIYNEESQQWETANDTEIDLKPYLSKSGMIQLKLDNSQNFYYEGTIPVLLLDSEVQ